MRAMKILRETFLTCLMVAGLSVAVFAQKNDPKKPPPKPSPPVVNPQPKNPPPKENDKPKKPGNFAMWKDENGEIA